MQTIASVYNLKQLNKWVDYLDGAILNFKAFSLIYDELDIDKAIMILKNKNKGIILAINKMIYPNETEALEQFILKYKDDAIFLVTDLACVYIAKKYNILDKIIYDPQTMITNYLDLQAFNSYNFKAIGMSLEIPFNDVCHSQELVNAPLFYQVFGYRLMFYSKRKLLTLYEQKANIKAHSHNLFIKESTRNDYFPIIENKNGTMIYRGYLINLLNQDLKNINYQYLESLYIDDIVFGKILKLFFNLKNKEISLDEFNSNLNDLNLNIEDGFTYKDSVYQKELF